MAINGVTAVVLLRGATPADSLAGLTTPLLVTAAGSSVARNVIALALGRGQQVGEMVRRDAGAAILSRTFAGLNVVSTEH